MIIRYTTIICCLAFLFSNACAAAARPFPAGPAQADFIEIRLAIYYTGVPASDPLAAMRAMVLRDFPRHAFFTRPPPKPAGMSMTGILETNARANAPAPDTRSLGLFGRGLTQDQAKALQGATLVLMMSFTHPKKDTLEGLRAAYLLSEKLARSTGGLLWDEDTREMFAPDAWQKNRLATWAAGVPRVSDHTIIHAYKSGELTRAITLGMSKFGLPDIVIDQFPWSSRPAMGDLINLLAQALAEGTSVGAGGNLDLDIKSILHPGMRADQLALLRPEAPSVARMALVNGRWEAGDPDNRQIEITFSRYAGPDVNARQDALLSQLYGVKGKVQHIRHDQELLAESKRAQMKLAGMQAEFARGLPPGEYIQVKAPFDTPAGGREWMWVEIKSWKGNVINGLLKNEPRNIPKLRGGQAVTVPQDKVFDYIRTASDGRSEGNTTGKIIEKMRDLATD